MNLCVFLLCVGAMLPNKEEKKKPVDYVNPFIGTKSMGHTFPGACVPYGAVQLSPDTENVPHNIDGVYQQDAYRYCAGYQYDDPTIVGFSHTHLSGTGHSDLGDILLMPMVGDVKLLPGSAERPEEGYRSRFSHEQEKASPGYYEVMLQDYDIKVQLTATERVGIHKYTYPAGKREGHVIVDLLHGIYNYEGKVLWANLRVENDTLLTGYRITRGWARTNYTYFAVTFSKPIKNYGHENFEEVKYRGFWRRFDEKNNFPEMGGRGIVAFFDFDLQGSPELEVKVALSCVSTEGALKNLQAEVRGLNFEQLAIKAREKWNKSLSVIEAQGNEDQLSMLYTSLYHTMINPSVYMDVDGQYRGVDHMIHRASDFTNYTVFSLWDTYRALHPLFNVMNRQRNQDMVKSMLAHYQQSVHKALPVWSHMGNENWCMIAYHGVAVVADAVAKGIELDKTLVLEAMKNSSNVSYYQDTRDYVEKGYVPVDKDGNGASITLENAYDDWTIYQTARMLGDKDMAEEYGKRALSYRNLFDDRLGFARPRLSNGSWKEPFDPLNTHGEGFIEGNSWNYSFHVAHDVNGLIRLMGGEKRFVERLDSLFTMHLPEKYYADTEDITEEGLMGNYVHGNEPSHHVLYLYAWTSQPWKTQLRVREVMNRMYRNRIDGLCGNDDCGQMSAWYIFSALGFYPVCPGTNQYVLGAPYLPYMKIYLENGHSFEVRAPKVSDRNRYVKSVKLNGKPYEKAYITQQDIQAGGILEFEMGSKPERDRIYSDDNKPYSLTR